MKNNSKKLIPSICAITLILSSVAQNAEAFGSKKTVKFTSGTGFFVTNNQMVTNNHVVKGCEYIKVRGAVESTIAKVVARDEENDLALLRTSKKSKRVAKFRSYNNPVEKGDDVTVMGYPLEQGIKGEYTIKTASVTDTKDAFTGKDRLQFTDSVEKGNSGGPLLDKNGRVIGVVVGKVSFYLAGMSSNKNAKPLKTSSIAIKLNSLKSFLIDNKVVYRTDSSADKEDKYFESKAKDYIVNVHCIKKS